MSTSPLSRNAYEQMVMQTVGYLRACEEYRWWVVGMIVGVIFLEPLAVICAIWDWIIYGFQAVPHFSNVNPTELSEDQLNRRPVLCLHGNFHAQSAFTRIAEELRTSDLAVFTVSLPYGSVSAVDYGIVRDKIEEIRQLYRDRGKETHIDIIGHSRGARIAYDVATTHSAINKVVLIGFHTHQDLEEGFLEINGYKEELLPEAAVRDAVEQAERDPERRKMFHTGHLGLLYAEETCQAVAAHLA